MLGVLRLSSNPLYENICSVHHFINNNITENRTSLRSSTETLSPISNLVLLCISYSTQCLCSVAGFHSEMPISLLREVTCQQVAGYYQ